MRRVCLLMTILCLGMAGFAVADGDQTTGAQDGRLALEGARTVGAQMTTSFEMGGYNVPSGRSWPSTWIFWKALMGPTPDCARLRIQAWYSRLEGNTC